MSAKTIPPAAPLPRLAKVREEILLEGEPTVAEAHGRLIDSIADKAAAEAVDRALAKARTAVKPKKVKPTK